MVHEGPDPHYCETPYPCPYPPNTLIQCEVCGKYSLYLGHEGWSSRIDGGWIEPCRG